MVVCFKCKESKEEESFAVDRRNKTGRNSYCRHCKAKIAREKSKAEKLKAIEYKGGKCIDCGNTYHQSVYDFHHLKEEDKKGHPAHLINRYGFEKAREELDKCILLCANCHRIRHHKENEDE